MDHQVWTALEGGVHAFWLWSGWPRAAEVATVLTAAATASIAFSLRMGRWSRISALERYLKTVGEKDGPEMQGLRSAAHLSRHLGMTMAEVDALAHASRKLESRLRTDESGETSLLWGYKGLIKGKD